MVTGYIKAREKQTGKQDPKITWRYFDSDLIDKIGAKEVVDDPVTGFRVGQHKFDAGHFRFHLAHKFGFCYGVKLAIWDALSALERHQGARILALSEMIHNPHVNDELTKRGAIFMDRVGMSIDDVRPTDVVIIPAFGTTVENFHKLKALGDKGCTLIDTTCRSVVDVWDQIQRYNALGLTSVIHGKHEHEETIATASQATRHLVVRDLEQAALVGEFIRGNVAEDEILETFAGAYSAEFRPARDLARIGMANQTTMRSSESEEVFALLREAMLDMHGPVALDHHYSGLDTICRATEVRQEAVIELVRDTPLDVMLVVGGFNSSNTKNLAKIAAAYVPTYHIEGAWAFDGDQIEHLHGYPLELGTARDWLPIAGDVGITAGASTPDNTVGDVIDKILALRPRP